MNTKRAKTPEERLLTDKSWKAGHLIEIVEGNTINIATLGLSIQVASRAGRAKLHELLTRK